MTPIFWFSVVAILKLKPIQTSFEILGPIQNLDGPCHFSVSPHQNQIPLFKSGSLQCDKSSNYQIST